MATVKINFEVELQNLPTDMEKIYLVGNDNKLGAWNPEEAVALKRTKTSPIYKGFRSIEEGTIIEFKVLKEQNWDTVEKGAGFEEITNRVLTVKTPETVKITVQNWK